MALYCLLYKPGINIIFITGTQGLAKELEQRARWILVDAFGEEGVSQLVPRMNTEKWALSNSSVINWRGREGQITGLTGHLIICDDLISRPEEVNSPALVKSVWEDVKTTIITRAINGTNIIFNATRWGTDDITGQLQRSAFGFSHINIPAISENDQGEEQALWPQQVSLDFLRTFREADPAAFETMYQGNPVASGSLLFNQAAQVYSELPKELTYAIGVDFAYTLNGSDSDWTVFAVLGKDKKTGKVYLVDLYRAQIRSTDYHKKLTELQAAYQCPIYFHAGPAEKGIVDLLSRQHGLRFNTSQARASKQDRAREFAGVWNRGDFLLPNQANTHHAGNVLPRLPKELMTEIHNFSEVPSKRQKDDCIDAISSAMGAFTNGGYTKPRGLSHQAYMRLF